MSMRISQADLESIRRELRPFITFWEHVQNLDEGNFAEAYGGEFEQLDVIWEKIQERMRDFISKVDTIKVLKEMNVRDFL